MTATPKRRRFLLPLLGTTLLAATGGGGWAAYQFGWLSGSPAAVADNDAIERGFAAANAADTPSQNQASPWAAEAPQSSPVAPNEALVADGLPAFEGLPALPDASPAGDLPAVSPIDQAGGVSDGGLNAVDPLDAAALAMNASDSELEPHTVRGQSPETGSVVAATATNPLRSSAPAAESANPLRSQPLPSNRGVEQAGFNAPPQPVANTSVSNPLRQVAATEVVPTSDDPLAGGLPDFSADFSGDLNPLPANDILPPTSAPAMPDGLAELDAQPLPAAPALPAAPPVAAAPSATNSVAAERAFDQPVAEVASLGEPASLPPAEPEYQSVLANPRQGRANDLRPASPNSSLDQAADFASTGAGMGRPGERALEGPQRPALVIQKFAPPEIQVGKQCKFIVKVRNMGQRPAENVIVTDQIPHGTQLVATAPQADQVAQGLAWQLGTLSPGEERSLEMTLLPVEEGEIGSVAMVEFAAQASAKTKCTRPQLALRMSAPSQVMIGRKQRVVIELHNPGTGDATGVMLLENVPDNLRHEAGPALEFEVGTLRAGETRRMELVLTAEKAGRVHNVLTARAVCNLQTQQHVDFEVIAPALMVEMEGPARRYLERPATYTVKVENPGTASAKDVQLVTQLPRGMKFVKANNLGEYDPSTHSIYWSLAELPAGQSGTVKLTALPVEPGDHVLEVKSRAREGLADQTTRQVSVEGLPAIMFEVSDLQDPIEVGGSTAYEIRVVNQGTKASTNVAVRVVTPPGMRVVSANGETRHRIDAQGVTFEPLGRLAPKADSIFRVQLQGAQAGDQRVLVEVNTDDLTQPVRKEESTRVFGDE